MRKAKIDEVRRCPICGEAVNRLPRQIVSFDVAHDKSPKRIQAIVDVAIPADMQNTVIGSDKPKVDCPFLHT